MALYNCTLIPSPPSGSTIQYWPKARGVQYVILEINDPDNYITSFRISSVEMDMYDQYGNRLTSESDGDDCVGNSSDIDVRYVTTSGEILTKNAAYGRNDIDKSKLAIALFPLNMDRFYTSDALPRRELVKLTFSGYSYVYLPGDNGVRQLNALLPSGYMLNVRRRYECIEPDIVTTSQAVAGPAEKVELSWSGAFAGTDEVRIKGYQIYRSTNADSGYTPLLSVDSTSTSGSIQVTSPNEDGVTYYYKIRTLASVQEYNSDLSVAYASLRCEYVVTRAPTTVEISSTNVAPLETATLSWSGATPGADNPIIGYQVYRSESIDGVYTAVGDVVLTSETSGQCEVTSSSTNGKTFYYRVVTVGELDGNDSAMSRSVVSLTTTVSSPGAPTNVGIDGETEKYTSPGDVITLSWSSAQDGVNNPVVSYDVYQNGELYIEGLSVDTTSCEVPAHAEPGGSYVYTVVAVGNHAISVKSRACTVYSRTDPTAPVEISVSDETPPADTRVTLSWSGATPGGFNAIVGYRVYRSTEINGEYMLIAIIDSTESGASCLVYAPVSGQYYYRVETVGERGSSGQSDAYVGVVTDTSTSIADTEITVLVNPKRPRAKRGMLIGDYDTAAEGWTLCEWSLIEPEAQTSFVEIPGRSAGPIDMSTVLTGGDPRYGSRELTARFECSEGTRLERNAIISDMMNTINGQRLDIVLPDDPERYVTGRLHITTDYSDMAHASATLTGVCDPWRYSRHETCVSVYLLGFAQSIILHNSGRRILSPVVVVKSAQSNISLTCGDTSWVLNAGEHKLHGFTLPHGNTEITCSGVGEIIFRYREAIL